MPAPKGRAVSSVKTPLLVRSYLMGDPFEDDRGRRVRITPARGDYISRMHHRIKRHIRQIAPGYQWPRSHSFNTFVKNLVTLELVEKTGRREKGKLDPARGFKRRTWVRLTPGSATRIEWADPMGYIALIYPGIRPVGRELATMIPTRRRKPRKPRVEAVRPRGRPPAAAPISPTVLRDLEEVRKKLVQDLRQAAARGRTVEEFDALRDRASAFLSRVNLVYGRTVYVEGRRDLDRLANCVRLLREAATTPTRLPIALTNCQASARLLADEISIPLPKTLERVAEARPAFAPIELPEGLNRRSALRLITHLRRLGTLGVEAPGVEEELARLSNLASDWESSARDKVDAESEKEEPNEERLERLEGVAEALQGLSSSLEERDIEGAVGALMEAYPGRSIG